MSSISHSVAPGLGPGRALPAAPRSLSIDLLKLSLAVCVVFIHVNPAGDLAGPWANLTGNGLYRLAVPAFFLLGGYHFAPAALAGRGRAYMVRMLGLYALWMALYLPFWIDLIAPERWLRNLLMLAFGWWHLWYLIATALAAGLTALMARLSTRSLLGLALGLGLIGIAMVYGLALGLYRSDWLFPGPAYWLHRNAAFLGLPFFLAGFLIRREGWQDHLPKGLLLLILALGLPLLLAEAALLQHLAGGAISADNLLTPLILSPALVLLALQHSRPAPGRWIGTLSAGLFFLHVAILVPLLKWTDLPLTAVAALTLAGSILLTLGLIGTGLDRRLF